METVLQHGISEPIFYGDLVYRFKRIIGKVRNRAKIRNRYNQAPHLTQDTNGKVTTSQ